MSNDDYFHSKFPEMTPITSVPTLSSVNGIGFMVYGNRDYDPESGTYVKTYVFCLLFLPILALRAYRVADAPTGWYFLGKVPLSSFARAWNWLLLGAGVIGAGVLLWVNRPEYQRQLAEAQHLASAGKLEQAAEKFRIVIEKYPDKIDDTLASFDAFLDGPVAEAKLEDAAPAWHIAVQLQQKHPRFGNVFDRAFAQAKQAAASDPRGAWKVLQAIAPLAPQPKELADFQVEILETHVAQHPDDLDAVSDLALSYEANKDFDRCVKLLEPHAKTLGDREGARILGQIYTGRGMFIEAYALLDTYAAERLKLLRTTEERLKATIKICDDRAIAQLKNRNAPGFDMARYNALGKDAQDQMVQVYLTDRLTEDLDYRTALEAMRRAAKVVPVALDLGIVLLRRGQGPDVTAEQRKEDLEKAEKTFLAIRGLAGNTDEFRLYLGQVYYWMGKHAQGKKLFDELLAAHPGKTETVLAVATLLREVGAASEACALTEQAYEKEGDLRKKYALASLRAVMAIDVDDHITWYRRGDPADQHVQASLQEILGAKALRESQEQQAQTHFDAALKIYASLPESATSLNNGAIVHISMFRLTGERKNYKLAIAMQQKAVSLKPGDSILISNVAETLMIDALWDVMDAEIDLKILKRAAGWDLLRYLYRDKAGRDKYTERFRASAGIVRARAQYEQMLVLSPRNLLAYSALDSLFLYTRALNGLTNLNRRLQDVDVDVRDFNRLIKDDFQGKSDEKHRKELPGNVKRLEAIVVEARKVGGATFAAAVANLITTRQSLHMVGEDVDPAVQVALADEAFKKSPSVGSQATLIQALLFRAHLALIKDSPAYAEMAEKTKRSLHSSQVMAFAMSQAGPLQKACMAQPDVARALPLVLDQFEKFPDEASEWSWAMLRHAQPEAAARIAKATLHDEIGKMDRAIVDKLALLNGSNALREFWLLQMAGQDQQAQAALRRWADKGVPLPGVK